MESVCLYNLYGFSTTSTCCRQAVYCSSNHQRILSPWWALGARACIAVGDGPLPAAHESRSSSEYYRSLSPLTLRTSAGSLAEEGLLDIQLSPNKIEERVLAGRHAAAEDQKCRRDKRHLRHDSHQCSLWAR